MNAELAKDTKFVIFTISKLLLANRICDNGQIEEGKNLIGAVFYATHSDSCRPIFGWSPILGELISEIHKERRELCHLVIFSKVALCMAGAIPKQGQAAQFAFASISRLAHIASSGTLPDFLTASYIIQPLNMPPNGTKLLLSPFHVYQVSLNFVGVLGLFFLWHMRRVIPIL